MGQGEPARHRIAALALTGLLALTGCTAEPEPQPTSASPTTASPTPTPTPTETAPTPPEKPSAWLDGTETGAIAAAEYFMDLYNYVLATGDLDPWESISARSCGFCTSVAEDVGATYGDGGRFEGGTVTTSNVELATFDPDLHLHTIRLDYVTTELQRYADDGTLANTTPAEDNWLMLDVGFYGSGWELVGVAAGPRD